MSECHHQQVLSGLCESALGHHQFVSFSFSLCRSLQNVLAQLPPFSLTVFCCFIPLTLGKRQYTAFFILVSQSQKLLLLYFAHPHVFSFYDFTRHLFYISVLCFLPLCQ